MTALSDEEMADLRAAYLRDGWVEDEHTGEENIIRSLLGAIPGTPFTYRVMQLDPPSPAFHPDTTVRVHMAEPGGTTPGTEAGRAVLADVIELVRREHGDVTANNLPEFTSGIRAIEAEARAAALDAVEEAVKGLHPYAVAPTTDPDGLYFKAPEVLAAIANLRSDGETR